MKLISSFAAMLSVALLLFACAGQNHDSPSPSIPIQKKMMTIQPSIVTLQPGETVQLKAVLSWASKANVLWSIKETGGGSISSSGLYTAPGKGGPFHVQAILKSDTHYTAEAMVTLEPPPDKVVTLDHHTFVLGAGQSKTFSATVKNDSGDKRVLWSIEEPDGGSITDKGEYTAPSLPGTYLVKATSLADPAESDSCAIRVLDAGTVADLLDLDSSTMDPTCFRFIPLEAKTLTFDSGEIYTLQMQLLIPTETRGRGMALEFAMDGQVISLAHSTGGGLFWTYDSDLAHNSYNGLVADVTGEPYQGLLSWGIFIPGDKNLIHFDPLTGQTTSVREMDFNGLSIYIGIQLNTPALVGQPLPFRLKRVGLLTKDGTMRNCTNIQKQTVRAIVR